MTLESKIQTAVITRLKKAGWVVDKSVQHSHNGWPDITAYRFPGRVLFIEVKRPGQAPTDLQKYWHSRLRTMGFDCHVIDNVKQLEKIDL